MCYEHFSNVQGRVLHPDELLTLKLSILVKKISSVPILLKISSVPILVKRFLRYCTLGIHYTGTRGDLYAHTTTMHSEED